MQRVAVLLCTDKLKYVNDLTMYIYVQGAVLYIPVRTKLISVMSLRGWGHALRENVCVLFYGQAV